MPTRAAESQKQFKTARGTLCIHKEDTLVEVKRINLWDDTPHEMMDKLCRDKQLECGTYIVAVTWWNARGHSVYRYEVTLPDSPLVATRIA